MAFQKGQAGIYHPRKSFAVGGKERVNVGAWLVTLENGSTLELQGRYTSAGHVRLHVQEYQKQILKGVEEPSPIKTIEKVAIDPDIEKIRCAK